MPAKKADRAAAIAKQKGKKKKWSKGKTGLSMSISACGNDAPVANLRVRLNS